MMMMKTFGKRGDNGSSCADDDDENFRDQRARLIAKSALISTQPREAAILEFKKMRKSVVAVALSCYDYNRLELDVSPTLMPYLETRNSEKIVVIEACRHETLLRKRPSFLFESKELCVLFPTAFVDAGYVHGKEEASTAFYLISPPDPLFRDKFPEFQWDLKLYSNCKKSDLAEAIAVIDCQKYCLSKNVLQIGMFTDCKNLFEAIQFKGHWYKGSVLGGKFTYLKPYLDLIRENADKFLICQFFWNYRQFNRTADRIAYMSNINDEMLNKEYVRDYALEEYRTRLDPKVVWDQKDL